jgi:hypothetical protein
MIEMPFVPLPRDSLQLVLDRSTTWAFDGMGNDATGTATAIARAAFVMDPRVLSREATLMIIPN